MMEWIEQGLCAQTDPELFFPEHGTKTANARRICRRCPVVNQCLEYALADLSIVGIWGGTSEKERRLMRQAAA